MTRTTRNVIAILATASLTLGATAASAIEGDADDEPKTVTDDPAENLSFWFDEVLGILVYGIVDPEAEEPLDCTPADELTADAEGVVDGMVPDGCTVLVIDGGDNGISHGEVVSQTVHALKEIRHELDAPFSHYVREIARSDAGKGDETDEEPLEPIEDADETADSDGPKDKDKDHGPPDHANAHGHDKREGSGSGGNGPPEHANAHGRDK